MKDTAEKIVFSGYMQGRSGKMGGRTEGTLLRFLKT